jgi:hypothetical protein
LTGPCTSAFSLWYEHVVLRIHEDSCKLGSSNRIYKAELVLNFFASPPF